jgi:adenylate cyclase
LLPVEAVLRAEAEYTLADMAKSAGLDEELLGGWISALGIGNPQPGSIFHDYALEAAAALKELSDAGLPATGIEEICRTAGRSTGSVAEAIRDVFGETFIQAGDSERDLGLRYAAAARRMSPAFEPLIRFTLTAHLLQVIRNDVVSRTERATGRIPGARRVAVCFADLADFTGAGSRLAPEQVSDLVRRFDALVQKCTPEEVRHVKTVGDAAMLVSGDPAAILHTACNIVESADKLDHGFPRVHAGIAIGRAVARDGDWHGHPVNVASRLAELAPPGGIYVSRAVQEEAVGSGDFQAVGHRSLKGIAAKMEVFSLSPGGAT